MGDFEIGSTVLHVTKQATEGHFRKAQKTRSGRSVCLLVPDAVLRAMKDLAEQFEPGYSKLVDIFSIEQFIAQNLEELAVFDRYEALKELLSIA